MSRPKPPAIDAYLEALAASLPRSRAARELLDEARDHLSEAAAAREVAGAGREAAEQAAVREFGEVAELAPGFRTVAVVSDARRQATRQLLGVLVLAGWIASTFHLIPVAHGPLPEPARPHPVALVAVITLLGPSLLLLGLSRTPWPWWGGQWLAWLIRARTLASWLFQLGLPVSAAMVAHQVALLFGGPHLWLAAGALGGHLVANFLVPVTSMRHFLNGANRPR
jgi:hypothetical protein